MYEPVTQNAAEAREQAQRIAFAPSVFQAARVLRDSGLLARVEQSGTNGLTLPDIENGSQLSPYAVRVLLDAALGIGLVTFSADRYRTTKTTWFLLHDPMTRVNMDFSHAVTYQGMQSLDRSLQTGAPTGLQSFGNWSTIYQALPHLPAEARRAWLAFDHYYSDLAFAPALAVLAAGRHRRVMDIGGNTGRFAAALLTADPEARVTIVDLPGQIAMARRALEGQAMADRIDWCECDLLANNAALPQGFDAIWMSQFLDCFSEQEIAAILSRCHASVSPSGRIYILEPFWDRQKLPAAAFCLQQTSLYFAALANGNSRMYTSDVMTGLVERAGFEVAEIRHPIGIVHSLMICRPAPDRG